MAAGSSNDGKPRLGDGGPGDQDDPAAPAAPATGGGVMGSQSGRPGHQPDPTGAPSTRPPPGPVGAEPERPTSETERIAGTPDDRATTDWEHGEGEPRPETAPGARPGQGRA